MKMLNLEELEARAVERAGIIGQLQSDNAKLIAEVRRLRGELGRKSPGRDTGAPYLLNVKQFHEKHPAFPAATIRDFIYKSRDRHSSRGPIPGNGLSPAIYKVGSKVLIDEAKFFEWLAKFKSL